MTATHTCRVVLYAQAMAEAAGLAPPQVRRIMRAAALHDLGKIDVPDEIPLKPGRLSRGEYEVIKKHTILGYDRLLRMDENDPIILAVVRSHHERVDGSGYPDGLKDDAIHPAARTFAVIDTFDAMTSIRPYHRRVASDAAETAISELMRYSSAWYCSKATELLRSLYTSGKLTWIMRHFNDAKSIESLPQFGPRAFVDARSDSSARTES